MKERGRKFSKSRILGISLALLFSLGLVLFVSLEGRIGRGNIFTSDFWNLEERRVVESERSIVKEAYACSQHAYCGWTVGGCRYGTCNSGEQQTDCGAAGSMCCVRCNPCFNCTPSTPTGYQTGSNGCSTTTNSCSKGPSGCGTTTWTFYRLQYAVNYVPNEGTCRANTTVCGNTGSPTANCTRDGYSVSYTQSGCGGSFNTTTGVCSSVTGTTTITANWTPTSRTVTYTRNNTSAGELGYYNKVVNYGSSSTPGPEITTYTGYVFNNFVITSGACAGTFTASTGVCSNVQEEMTIQANWSLKTYTVTYTRNNTLGGSLSYYSKVVNHGSSSSPAPAVTTNMEYDFNNFTITSGSCAGTFDASTGVCSNVQTDMTIQANWTIKTFTVQYDGNGGTCEPISRTVGYGSTADSPSCTREGYSLVNFVRSVGSGGTLDVLTGEVSNVTGDQTIRAE